MSVAGLCLPTASSGVGTRPLPPAATFPHPAASGRPGADAVLQPPLVARPRSGPAWHQGCACGQVPTNRGAPARAAQPRGAAAPEEPLRNSSLLEGKFIYLFN